MKNFNDVGALRSVLQDVYERCPSQAEQRLANFAGVLEQQLDFTKNDAALYASIVLTRNAGCSSSGRAGTQLKCSGHGCECHRKECQLPCSSRRQRHGSFLTILPANTNSRPTKDTCRPLDRATRCRLQTANSSFGRRPICTTKT